MDRAFDDYVISTDRERLDVRAIHAFLAEQSYWARGVTREVVDRSIENSIPFGAYRGDEQVGFARVVTDRATFAWLADVFILPGERGSGLGKALVEFAVGHPDVRGVRRQLLATADAHGLYERFGFRPLERAQRFMVIEPPAATLPSHER
jgi:GNAT superfamily N-acetyltransferase